MTHTATCELEETYSHATPDYLLTPGAPFRDANMAIPFDDLSTRPCDHHVTSVLCIKTQLGRSPPKALPPKTNTFHRYFNPGQDNLKRVSGVANPP